MRREGEDVPRPEEQPASAGTSEQEARHERPKPPPRTRTSTAFKGFAAGFIVLVLLLIFILENGQRVKISYLGATGHLPLGVALLLAAAGGALLIAIIGFARLAQVRRHVTRRQR